MRTDTKTSLQLWRVKRPRKRTRIPAPPVLFPVGKIPVVDAHMHIYPGRNTAQAADDVLRRYLRTMDRSGITLSINLQGSRETVAAADRLHALSGGRILQCPGGYLYGGVRKLWWTAREMKGFVHPNIAGIKVLNKYAPDLFSGKRLLSLVQRQSELGLPFVGMHIADPPFKDFWQPEYWPSIVAAERLIRRHSDLTFIMAHGFWLMTTDEGLSVLATYLDAYPNLNVDLSATMQWWNTPYVTYDSLRRFLITYKGRLLYGTDGNPTFNKPRHFRNTFELLETAEPGRHGFFTEPKAKTHMTGLNLPPDVLNHIYWWNAARLLPAVHAVLKERHVIP